ncbi:permease [Loigolactobacillus backii]|uniref:Putative hemin transport system permease protein HrtB n=1 Tax=Loigolactobacillus backii TaxID=375175 RepID=A0A192H6B1_9LACO|nr:ABC transporter permease [Loigolactobacillus backii]ANK63531.1 permease [Loigolactobacillus backii]ANK70816.1 permease [Loigolactobacillus backii]
MFLALRDLRHAKLKFGLISLIIFLIVFLVLFITGLAAGLASDNGAAISESPASGYVLQKGAENRFSRSTLTKTKAQQLAKKFKQATPLTIQQGTIQRAKDAAKKTDMAYFVVKQGSFIAPKSVSGQTLNTTGVVVSDKLKASGYRLGQKFKDSQSGVTLKIIGFTTAMTYSHTPVVYVTPNQWQKMMPQETQTVSALAVKQTTTTKPKLAGANLVSKEAIIQNVPGYSAEQGSLDMIIAFLYIISVVVLAVFFYVITIQKIREFGVLKALGTKTSYLARYLIGEIGVVALLAVIIADIVVAALAQVMPAAMPFIISGQIILTTSLIFVVVAVLSAVVSLVKVARVDPNTAIGGAGE